MFAIIKTGSKQYKVKSGDVIQIEKRDIPKSGTLKLNEVLLVSKDSKTEVGKPFVKGAHCELELIKALRSPKTISFKYIRREKSATKIGHRQNYLQVKVKNIQYGT